MLKNVIKIVISALLIWWLVSNLNIERIVANMATADPWGLLLAVMLLGSLPAVQAIRWSLITRAIGKTLHFKDAFSNVLIGIFFNQILPSSIGGDAIRIWRTYRLGLGLVPAAHSVMLDRLTALLALVLMAGAGMPVIFSLLGDSPERWGVPALVAGGLFAFGALLLFDRVPGRFIAWRPLRAAAELSADARRVLLRPACTFPALAISICIHTGVAMTVYIITQSMGLSVHALDCVVLVPPVMLFSMIPISIAGWGVREGAMLTAFSFVGIGSDEAFALSILFGLAILVTGVPGGIIWLLSGSKRKQDKVGAQTMTQAVEHEDQSK